MSMLLKLLQRFKSTENLPKSITLFFGFTGFALTFHQLKIASDESVKANVLRQIRLVESHEEKFYTKMDGVSYSDLHVKLVNNPNYIGISII